MFYCDSSSSTSLLPTTKSWLPAHDIAGQPQEIAMQFPIAPTKLFIPHLPH